MWDCCVTLKPLCICPEVTVFEELNDANMAVLTRSSVARGRTPGSQAEFAD